MRGLLVKDFKLLKQQGKIITFLVFICIFMLGQMQETSFVVGYITSICVVISLSTISYDEFDNGNTFLFSLPITREEYVREKYALSFLVNGGVWLLSSIAAILVNMVRVDGFILSDEIMGAILVLAACMVLVAVMIPIQLKFGSEKSKVIIFASIGIIAVAGYFTMFLLEKTSSMIDISWLLGKLMEIGKGGLTGLAVGIGVVLLVLSMRVSQNIMKKKEF